MPDSASSALRGTTGSPAHTIATIDYDTLNRAPKDRYHWYRGLITAHRARTEEPAR
ncbi:hypothetical protein ACH4S9_16015 [Streptomyces sp. NPDC021225]|uniref:hypothetical protein n=1 Tax=Streptomyces sp. NPDC021225 TaxID=3365121 RepID=UPI0037A87002